MEMTIKSYNPCNATFQRYMIVNNHHEKWTGETWTKNKNKALVYSDLSAACKDLKQLKDKQDATPKQYYEATLHLRVTGDGEINPEALEEYARQSIKILINRDVPPPVPNGEVEVFILWDIKKKEVRNEE